MDLLQCEGACNHESYCGAEDDGGDDHRDRLVDECTEKLS